MFTWLGTGWKTVTGALVWALAHVGLITTVLGFFGIAGGPIQAAAALVGQALVVVGLAHKVNNFNLAALLAALKDALTTYTGQGKS